MPPRKHLSPRSNHFRIRFAYRLRALLDERGMGPTEFVERLHAAGLHVNINSAKKWLNGNRIPSLSHIQAIGDALKLKDYRMLLPPKLALEK